MKSIDGFILIQARSGNDAAELAAAVASIPGVTKAQRVNGAYDVIAEVRAAIDDQILPAETAIRELDGVLRAIPLLVGAPATVAEGTAA
jgi:DNA-binding Lrp family transcriptional regulator